VAPLGLDAIAVTGHSPTLLGRLSELEVKLAEATAALRPKKSRSIETTSREAKEFVFRSHLDLRTLLQGAAQPAKMKLSQHIGQLTFTPRDDASYAVSGEWNLLPKRERVIYMVARDGSRLNYRPVMPLELIIYKGRL
jgi:hypothetical protein